MLPVFMRCSGHFVGPLRSTGSVQPPTHYMLCQQSPCVKATCCPRPPKVIQRVQTTWKLQDNINFIPHRPFPLLLSSMIVVASHMLSSGRDLGLGRIYWIAINVRSINWLNNFSLFQIVCSCLFHSAYCVPSPKLDGILNPQSRVYLILTTLLNLLENSGFPLHFYLNLKLTQARLWYVLNSGSQFYLWLSFIYRIRL